MSEPERRRLYRSRTERMVSGVSGGLANYFDVDPVLIRLAWVVLTIASSGAFALAYLLLWIVIPVEGQPYAGRETMRQNVGEVAGEARAFAGEVREAFRTETSTEPAPPGAAVDPTPPPSSPPPSPAYRRDRQVWGGAVLIALGVIFLAQTSGFLGWLHWNTFWPLVLIAIGGVLLWQRARG